MYCTRCGKQINYDSPICAECVEQLRAEKAAEEAAEAVTEEVRESETAGENVAPETAAEQPREQLPRYSAAPVAPSGSPVMRGFGNGLASAILGFVAYIFGFLAIAILEEWGNGALLLLALPATVVSIVLGICAIKTFASSTARPRPIPALVLGISGVSLGGISAFINMLTVFVALIA